MRNERAPIVILLDEDDEEDRMLACDAPARNSVL
jgi:DNA-binding response OmpR family regulator